MPLTEARLHEVLPKLRDAAGWASILNDAMQEFGISSDLRMAAFLAQIAHESGELRRLVENLNYSAAGLRKTWPRRFKSDARAREYAHDRERIANFVYASRLGNGDVASGDGWRFRGRGLLQVTGRANYRSSGLALGLPLEAQPETLEQPRPAARASALYWRSNGLNELCDLSGDRIHDDEDFVVITKRINGGVAGLAERLRYWGLAKKALGVA